MGHNDELKFPLCVAIKVPHENGGTVTDIVFPNLSPEELEFIASAVFGQGMTGIAEAVRWARHNNAMAGFVVGSSWGAGPKVAAGSNRKIIFH